MPRRVEKHFTFYCEKNVTQPAVWIIFKNWLCIWSSDALRHWSSLEAGVTVSVNSGKLRHSALELSGVMLVLLYSASQKKRNREVSMFYHNLITTIINEWYIFGKLRVSLFHLMLLRWCIFHAWVIKSNLKEGNQKTFGGRYLNFEEKFTFLESWVSALSYDTSIRKNERGMTKLCLFEVVLAFP